MAAQRVDDYDLNCKLTLNVAAAPAATSSVTHTGNNNNSIQEFQPPKIDSYISRNWVSNNSWSFYYVFI